MRLASNRMTAMRASLAERFSSLLASLSGHPETSRRRAGPPMIPDHDRLLLWTILILLTVSVIMVYSASFALADAKSQPFHFLVRHCAYIGVAVVTGLMLFRVPLKTWQELAPWLFIGGCVLLVS